MHHQQSCCRKVTVNIKYAIFGILEIAISRSTQNKEVKKCDFLIVERCIKAKEIGGINQKTICASSHDYMRLPVNSSPYRIYFQVRYNKIEILPETRSVKTITSLKLITRTIRFDFALYLFAQLSVDANQIVSHQL